MSRSLRGFLMVVPGLSRLDLSVDWGEGSTAEKSWVSLVWMMGQAWRTALGHEAGSLSC